MVAAELVDLAHDRLERRFIRIGPVLPARRQLATRQQLLERHPPARDAALDRADCTAADLGCFLVSEPARADEDQRFALRLRQVHKRTLHVAEFDVPVLARRRCKNLRRGNIIPFALEARTAHLAQEKVAKDDEGPSTHVGAGGFAYEEAAEICGCAVGTIKSRVARGRVALEQLLSSGKLPSRRQHRTDPDKSALQTIMGEVDHLSRDHEH